ncbi:hypothetical protein Tco_0414252 [Tanacetum coccineum]
MATGREIVSDGFVVEACWVAVDMGVCGVGVWWATVGEWADYVWAVDGWSRVMWCTSNGERQGLRNNIWGIIDKVILGGGGWVDSAIGENGFIKSDMTGDNNVIGG